MYGNGYNNGMGAQDPYLDDPYGDGIQHDEGDMQEGQIYSSAEFGPGEIGTVEANRMREEEIMMSQNGNGEFIPENDMNSQGPVNTMIPKSVQGAGDDIMTLAQAASSGDADTILRAVEKFSKSQLVRFLDVSIIGPFLLILAIRGKIGPMQRLMLGLTGAGTVIYNYRNWTQNRKIMQPEKLKQLKAELEASKVNGENRQPVEDTVAGYYGYGNY